MKIMVKSKSWNEILISCTLLVITYGILAMQVGIYHKTLITNGLRNLFMKILHLKYIVLIK
jgi:hypothetical protein